jgi:hypothetical protein
MVEASIMDMSYTQDVYMSRGTEYDTIWYQIYWNESTLYNFRTSNYCMYNKAKRSQKLSTVILL